MATFKITEEQYRRLCNEEADGRVKLDITANTEGGNNNEATAAADAVKNAQAAGVNTKKTKLNVQVGESRVYSVRDFIKTLTK